MATTRLITASKLASFSIYIFIVLQPNLAVGADAASKSKLEKLSKIVLKYEQEGKPEEIIATLQPVADDYPNDAFIPYWLFDSYAALGCFEQAKPWLSKLIELSEQYDSSMWALFYYISGNEEALHTLLANYRTHDKEYSATAYTILGIAASASGSYEYARYFFDKSKALTEEPYLILHYALALRELGYEQQARAIITQRKQKVLNSLANNPEDQHANFVMAEIRALAGDAESATKYMRKAVGQQHRYDVYWGISDENMGDNLWEKVRDAAVMQAFLAEKRQQIEESREQLKTYHESW